MKTHSSIAFGVFLIVVLPGVDRSLHAQERQGQQAPQASQQQASTLQPPDEAIVSQAVKAVVVPWMQKTQAPGVIAVVRFSGKTRYFPLGMADRAKHKPVTSDTIFELASITKVFTTTSLALEVLDGRMRLEDSVAEYVPFLGNSGGDIRQVTLEQLATHTSSLQRVPTARPPGGEWNKRHVMEWLAQWRAPYPPGTKSLYSNVGVGLLGHAIADGEEKPLIEVWRHQFLGPLGMHHTFFVIPPEAAAHVAQGYSPKGEPVAHTGIGGWPAGGRLSSSGRDMAEFLVANLGEHPERPKISEAMQFAQRPYFEVSPKMTQGLAWQRVRLQGELVIDKNGGLTGTSTYIGMLPERHIGVVLMANRGKCQATGAGRRLLLALVAKEHQDNEPDEEQ